MMNQHPSHARSVWAWHMQPPLDLELLQRQMSPTVHKTVTVHHRTWVMCCHWCAAVVKKPSNKAVVFEKTPDWQRNFRLKQWSGKGGQEIPVPLIELQEWVLCPVQTVLIARSQHLHLHQPTPDARRAETMYYSVHVNYISQTTRRYPEIWNMSHISCRMNHEIWIMSWVHYTWKETFRLGKL